MRVLKTRRHRARPPLPTALLAMSLATMPLAATAQEEPPEGCFCLAEAGRTLPQIIRGCTGEKFPGRFFWTAVCRSIDETGQEIVTDPIMITEDWTILPMGDAECSVCEPERRQGPLVPRGDGGEDSE